MHWRSLGARGRWRPAPPSLHQLPPAQTPQSFWFFLQSHSLCFFPLSSRFPSSPLPALVGNNRVYRGWGMLVGYYLPGNSPAAPPEHRAGGSTAHEEVQQSQFDPFPPGRCPGGAGNIFCQLGHSCKICNIHVLGTCKSQNCQFYEIRHFSLIFTFEYLIVALKHIRQSYCSFNQHFVAS